MARAAPAARAVGERGCGAVLVDAEQRQAVAAAHGHVQAPPVRRERGMRRQYGMPGDGLGMRFTLRRPVRR